MPSIILTKAEHDKITQATNKIFKFHKDANGIPQVIYREAKAIPYITLENWQILEGLDIVYKEYPELLELCKKMLNTSPVK